MGWLVGKGLLTVPCGARYPGEAPQVPSHPRKAAVTDPELLRRLDPTPPHRLVAPPPPAELALLHHFAGLTDPRLRRTRRHELDEVLLIAFSAVLGGADSWVAVENFGHAKIDWFRRF